MAAGVRDTRPIAMNYLTKMYPRADESNHPRKANALLGWLHNLRSIY